jgi:exonuclease VII large subunit
MKTAALILTSLLITRVGWTQGTVVTSAPTIEAVISSTSSDLNAKLTQLLDQATQQNTKLQTSLDRMGDPAAINLPSIQLIKDDILQSTTTLKTRDEQRTAMSGLTGAEVFDDDAFGAMTPIGATVTLKDGTVVDRDPEKYRMDAVLNAQVKEFQDVRQKALDRKAALNTEIGEVLQDLEAAQDMSSTLKLQAMLTALYAQMDECNQTILIAKADAEMAEKELLGQARVMSKAKSEESQLKRPRTTSGGGVGTGDGTFPGAGSAPRSMPFGRKGSDSNPGSGGSSTP